MAVHDAVKLPEGSRPIVQPNPHIGTPIDDGSRYLDALKRLVKPKPKPRNKSAAETQNKNRRPEPTPTRDKPEVDRGVATTSETKTKPRETTGRDVDARNADRAEQPSSSKDATETQQPLSKRRESATQASQTASSNISAGVIPSDEPTPPAHFLELFSELAADTNAASIPTAESGNLGEPLPPAGLVGLVTAGVSAGGGVNQVTTANLALQPDGEEATESSEESLALGTDVVDVLPVTAGDADSSGTIAASTPQAAGLSSSGDANHIDIAEEQAATESSAPRNTDTTPGNNGIAAVAVSPNDSKSPETTGSVPSTTLPSSGNAAAINAPVHGVAGSAKPTATVDAGSSTTNPASTGATSTDTTKPATTTAPREAAANPRGQFAQRVIDAVRGAVGGNRSFRMVLQPPELGVLQVEISTDANGKMTARLDVQTQAAHQALSDNLTDLRSALSRQGITLERIEIQLSESTPGEERDFGDQQSEQQDNHREDRQEHRESQRNETADEQEAETESPAVTTTTTSSEELIDLQV